MKSRETELTVIYLFFELIILNMAILITDRLGLTFFHAQNYWIGTCMFHGNLSWIITYLILTKKNLYLRDGFINRILRISYRTMVFLVVSAVINFLLIPKGYSRTFFVEYTFLFYIGMVVFYRLLYSYLRLNRRKGYHVNRVLIVGINDTTLFLKNIIQSNPILGYKFIGYINNTASDDPEILGTPHDLSVIIEKHHIQMVFVSHSVLSHPEALRQYLKICKWMGVRLRIVPENQNWLGYKRNTETVGGISLANPQEIPLDFAGARLWKRSFDLIVSSLSILLIFSWLFPILILLLKTTSKGPVFFTQKRTGINNKTFNCIKFRSMQVNPDADQKQATCNDSRITTIGSFLRKTNLDELPQFFNVFMGQMSLIGPRPHMLKHTDQYSRLIEHYRTRHYIKPGITGWAQVNGLRGETDQLWKMEKRVEYDMHYIENWDIWFDFKIIALTLFDKKTYNNAR